jgi:hypothetical protein
MINAQAQAACNVFDRGFGIDSLCRSRTQIHRWLGFGTSDGPDPATDASLAD